MESLKLIDQADVELHKLSAVTELLSLAELDGVRKDAADGVYYILRNTIDRLDEILNELQRKLGEII